MVASPLFDILKKKVQKEVLILLPSHSTFVLELVLVVFNVINGITELTFLERI